ncbi:MAG: hypothetical protein FJ290_30555 [Planctomycetes bacterium]|nr:hypothetical protein [Planctomycetota bacterium]
MTTAGRERRRILITVKTYPQPSMKYEETVCVAGIDVDSPQWIRLYPVQYRDLPFAQQFRKYEIVSLFLEKHRQDSRPESYRPDYDSLVVEGSLPAGGDWYERRRFVEPTASESMCAIQMEHKATKKSLGCFRPGEVEDFIIETDLPQWEGKQRSALLQLSLFETARRPLEKVPLKFFYRYRCRDRGCPGHRQMFLDWEAFQLYRNLRAKVASLEVIKQKLREKFLDELCGAARDTFFFVGNHSTHPASFMVLGVFYPLHREPTLFDGPLPMRQ